MSSIWTPGGEHEVPRQAPGGAEQGPGEGRSGPERQLTEDEEARLEEAAREVAAVRAQLVAAPADAIVVNHAMGLYELAAIHLMQEEPNLAAARLAIDAFAAIIDSCRGRLGEAEPTLTSLRSQVQLAFVSVSQGPVRSASGGPTAGPVAEPTAGPEATTGPGEEGGVDDAEPTGR